MVKTYEEQHLVIKGALNSVDKKPKNKKIIFEESNDSNHLTNGKQSKALFESDDDAEDNFNFELKPQFSGKKGEKLFELQSKYKGDKRFALDERFIDTKNDEEEAQETTEVGEYSLEEEKKQELGILEQVLGTKLKKKELKPQDDGPKKRMLRYDPTQSDHVKFHVTSTSSDTAPKTKTKSKKKSETQKEENNELQQPSVSKDVFYKVDDDLKSTLQEKQEFSLLNLFGKKEAGEEDVNAPQEEETLLKNNIQNKAFLDENPFRYDSSDDEPEPPSHEKQEQDNRTPMHWFEPFFLRDDDYRLQEGSDFVKRIASERNAEFGRQRRNLKDIVKAKVRNNQRKNNPFKKKLGGNKRKKMIRIKKAMKR